MLRLDHKIALITGGGSGIGKAIAELFARQGAIVCILDRDETGGNSVVASIQAEQGQALFLPVNVASQEDVQQVIDTVVDRYGTVDILVNNAGIAHVGNAETTTTADFDRLMQVNVQGVYNCLHAVLPIMKQNGGVILNSTNSQRPNPSAAWVSPVKSRACACICAQRRLPSSPAAIIRLMADLPD